MTMIGPNIFSAQPSPIPPKITDEQNELANEPTQTSGAFLTLSGTYTEPKSEPKTLTTDQLKAAFMPTSFIMQGDSVKPSPETNLTLTDMVFGSPVSDTQLELKNSFQDLIGDFTFEIENT